MPNVRKNCMTRRNARCSRMPSGAWPSTGCGRGSSTRRCTASSAGALFFSSGWEPIDAYRKLLDQYAAKRAFVVHDPALRAAVYSYFEHKFVYADEAKARFYFEKPYWERTPEEMKAAGF